MTLKVIRDRLCNHQILCNMHDTFKEDLHTTVERRAYPRPRIFQDVLVVDIAPK